MILQHTEKEIDKQNRREESKYVLENKFNVTYYHLIVIMAGIHASVLTHLVAIIRANSRLLEGQVLHTHLIIVKCTDFSLLSSTSLS